MYALLNTTDQLLVDSGLDKETLTAVRDELRTRNPENQYEVFTQAIEKTPEQLELLYGLTLELLKVGKINPLFIKLTKIDLLGNETEITALQVINDARACNKVSRQPSSNVIKAAVTGNLARPSTAALMSRWVTTV